MNIAAILALLLSSGACAKSEFHASSGTTLQVVVCPMMAPDAGQETAPDAPPAPPAAPPKDERKA
jgi:hypothetical protein